MSTFERLGWGLLTAWVMAGCGGGDDSGAQTETGDAHPYKPGETTVVGQGDTPQEFTTPAGAGCLKDKAGVCVDLSKECGANEKVDVVVDKQGVVVSVICYPTGSAPVTQAETNPPTGRTYANNEVVVLDDKDDGADVTGNVDVDSNNVTVWGESPATSVIDGSVTISKNNGIVRGVRIKGDVTITGNDSAVLLSVIEGNVTITGNNNVLASCDVYGKITVQGNNDAVVSNRVAGAIEASSATCHDNVTLTDPNNNKTFDAGEAGAAIECGGKKDK